MLFSNGLKIKGKNKKYFVKKLNRYFTKVYK